MFAVSRHEVYLNIGELGRPEFDFPVPIYCEGLGSIYWHMVSQTARSSFETNYSAVEEGNNPEALGRLGSPLL